MIHKMQRYMSILFNVRICIEALYMKFKMQGPLYLWYMNFKLHMLINTKLTRKIAIGIAETVNMKSNTH